MKIYGHEISARANLAGVDRRGADLTDAHLEESDLRGANHTDAILVNVHLQTTAPHLKVEPGVRVGILARVSEENYPRIGTRHRLESKPAIGIAAWEFVVPISARQSE